MSIARKFTLLVVLALLSVMVLTIWIFSIFERSEELAKLRMISTMTGQVVEESLALQMAERNGNLDAKLDDVRASAKSIGNIWLLNNDGIIRNSTDRASLGRRWEPGQEASAGLRSEQSYFVKNEHIYRWIKPVENKERCRKCHDPRDRFNGTLIIDFSVKDLLEHVRKEVVGASVILVAGLVLIGAAVLFLWNQMVRKRLNRVIENVKHLKQGAYAGGPPRKGHDEFTELEQYFNDMANAVQARDAEKESLLRELSAANEGLRNEIAVRVEAEARIKEQQLFSDSLTLNSAVATFVVNGDHTIITWNRACEKLTGFAAAAMLGSRDQWKPFYRSPRKTLADLVLDGEEGSPFYEKYSASTLLENGLHAEGWYESLNGRDRYLIFDAAPIHDSTGRIIAAIETLQDVTVQKRAEAALAGSEAKLRTIIETEPECVKLLTADATILEMNKAGLDMVEADEPGKVVGSSMLRLVVPEHRQALLAHLRRVLKQGPETLEFEIINLKGTRRWFETRTAPLPYQDDRAGVLLQVTRDVTDRKRSEQLLQDQLQFLQTLMETIPMPLFYKDAQGAYLGCNRAFEQFMGVSKEQLIGKGVHDIASGELADLYYRRDRELFENPGVQVYESQVRRSDGSVRTVVISKGTYRGAQADVAGLIGMMHDITERKEALEKLRQTNQMLETLVNASPIPIQVLDPEGRIKLWNPAAERLFGWTAEEAVGRLNPIVQDGKQEEFRMFRERVLRGDAFTGIETQRRNKGGALIDLSLSAAPLHDQAGNVNGILAILVDITERKRAEASIKRHSDTQSAINWILHISLENMPIEKILKQALDLILSIPWLSFESRGAIFLIDESRPDILVLKAARGLSEDILHECGTVPLGTCICGLAAARGEVVYTDRVDERHHINYPDISGHGHYCVPIKYERKVIGVINIYINEGHQQDHREIEFLNAIAKALAGVIRRSRAERALQESERRYRTLAEAAHDIIFIAGKEGRIRYMNSYGADLFGRQGAEFAGQNIEQLFRSDISPRERLNFFRVFQTGQSLYTENAFFLANRDAWLGTWLVPLKDEHGDVDSVLGVARDITERKRSEQEREKLILDLQNALDMISRSHKEWQDTFDSITDMIAIIDRDHRIIKANTAFANFFGFHPKEIIHRTCYEFYHRSEKPVPGCPHQKTLLEGKSFSEELFDKKAKRLFLVTTFPYRSPDGDVIGSIHVSRDITDEKDREARLIMSERLAALGQMASGIAHEINNPLASIAGCSEGMLSRIKKGQADQKLFETYLNIIQEEIFRCKSITTAMLSFVRKTTYEKKEVNLADMLDRTLEIIGFQGRLKDVSIERRYGSDAQLLQANEGELRQVFLAVITNALDAMQDNGVLAIETGAAGSSSYVLIRDSGPGIPEESLPRVFDPFFTTKAERGGTGLGLSIARKIIHNHNGNIEVSSEAGKGASFKILLPR